MWRQGVLRLRCAEAFFPENIASGWAGDGLVMGTRAQEPPTQELLGHWLPPVAMVLGLLTIMEHAHPAGADSPQAPHQSGWQAR